MDTTSISSHTPLMMIRPLDGKPGPAPAPAEPSPVNGQADECATTAPPCCPPRAERSESLLEQLKADWGKGDSPWDLNQDGTVDVRDFLELLTRLGTGDQDSESTPETGSPVDQLLADWGKADSKWDLNEDGTVDVQDFLELLARMGGDPSARDDAIAQLKADWGKSDSPWDLNQDGTVDVQDFLKLLDVMSGGEQPASPSASPVEQLKADWGKSDSPWDLDGDGTVGVRDFLELLAGMGTRSKEPESDPDESLEGANPAPQTVEEPSEANQTLSPLQQLLADWGKSDSRWDLNGDGTVNVRDFLAMLAHMSHRNGPQDGPPEPGDPQRSSHLTRRAVAAYRPSIFDHTTLLRRGLGFTAVG